MVGIKNPLPRLKAGGKGERCNENGTMPLLSYLFRYCNRNFKDDRFRVKTHLHHIALLITPAQDIPYLVKGKADVTQEPLIPLVDFDLDYGFH
jgi:hypothetical protein